MKKYLTICLLGGMIFVPQMVFGWGMTGHRVIGELAQKRITPAAAKNIDAVLKHASIAMVANWGDFIRSDENFKGVEVWHYKDIAPGLTREAFNEQAVTKRDGELIVRVNELIAALKKDPSNDQQLKLLIHLIGDMHQPLHMGRPEDKGGNTIKFTWFGKNTNLHSLWDEGLIDFQKLSYTEYANYLYDTKSVQTVKFEPQMILNWAWATYLVAEKIYGSTGEIDDHYKYNFKYVSTLEDRLALAGMHLAAVLNYIYDTK